MPGNSHGEPCGQRVQHVGLLGADGRRRLGAERDELLGADLGVVEAQAGPADAVVDDRVERRARRRRRRAGRSPSAATTRWRTVGLRSRARLASDSSWAITNSGMNLGSCVGRAADLLLVDHGVGRQAGQGAVAVAPVEEHLHEGERL